MAHRAAQKVRPDDVPDGTVTGPRVARFVHPTVVFSGGSENLSGSLAKSSGFRRVGQRLSDESTNSAQLVQDGIAGPPLRI